MPGGEPDRGWWRRAAATGVLVVVLALGYGAWMTGGSFHFSEIQRFPNHLMLARAFAGGHLAITETPRVDVIHFEGRRYLYFGPVPAAIRTPLEVLGIDPPTGLMVCLLGAGIVGLFAALVRVLAAPDAVPRWLAAVFVAVFAANGLTLFMVGLPSVHHESILWAVLFLLTAVLALLRSARPGAAPRLGWVLGTAVALAVGSRFSYLPVAALVVVAYPAVARARGGSRGLAAAVLRAGAPLVLMLGILALYNTARFQSPFDFGLDRLASRYQDYLSGGNFWRLDHVPYNLWDYLARPPEPSSRFPYLEATITMSEVNQLSATPRPPYRLLHVNELAVSMFVLLPLTLLAVPATWRLCRQAPQVCRWPAVVLTALVAVQLGVLSLTIAATARYMFDFVPLVMLLAFIGAAELVERWPRGISLLVAALAVLTLTVSLLLPFSAAIQYDAFLGYHGPLSAGASPPS